jgi:hypothetical protein
VAREIHRVLSPGGIWINISWPLATFAADLTTMVDLPQFLGRTGFELVETSTIRRGFRDLSPISIWAATWTYPEVFFTAKKIQSGEDQPRDPFAAYFAGESERVWTVIPELRTDISIGYERNFSRLGITEERTLTIETRHNPDRISLSGPTAELAEWVLQRLTESRTIRSIADEFRELLGQEVSEAEMIEFFSRLYEWQFIEINE